MSGDRPPVHLDELGKRLAGLLACSHVGLEVRRLGRTERTAALRVHVRRGPDRFFAKVFTADTVEDRAPSLLPVPGRRAAPRSPALVMLDREWSGLTALRSVMPAGTVPEPVARDDRVMVMTWVEGRPLQQVFGRFPVPGRADAVEAGAAAAGRWLGSLHRATTTGTTVFDLLRARETVARYAAEQRHVRSPLAVVGRLLAQATDLLGTSRPVLPVAASHGDFSLPNLLMGGQACDGLAVVDFEHFGERAVVHDLAVFLANVRTNAVNPLMPSGVVESVEDAFLGGYGGIDTPTRTVSTVLATTWLVGSFAKRQLEAPVRRLLWSALARTGRGFADGPLERVTWRTRTS